MGNIKSKRSHQIIQLQKRLEHLNHLTDNYINPLFVSRNWKDKYPIYKLRDESCPVDRCKCKSSPGVDLGLTSALPAVCKTKGKKWEENAVNRIPAMYAEGCKLLLENQDEELVLACSSL